MQLSNAPGKLPLPFASAGAKNSIPVDSQVSTSPGAASLVDGFPPLTRTPIAAGGVPPSGLDMNGVLYELSALLKWFNAGGGFPYDATFATDANVNGYPKGARVMRSDSLGYWLNTIDGNTADPESTTVGEAAAAGWVPDMTSAMASVAMTNANVTLTPAQYGKPTVTLSGVLTANLNLIFPSIYGKWVVDNNCTGPFTVNCKTASGAGVNVSPGKTRIVYCDEANISAAVTESDTFPLFDASTGIATMGALQAAGMHFPQSPGVGMSANTLLTASQAGKWAKVIVSGLTVTLPPLADVPYGAAYPICAAQGFTLKGSGADKISPVSGTGANTYAASTGETLVAVSNGPGGWFIVCNGLAPAQALGQAQVWQNLLGSRALGTTYYNTTGRPICVDVHAISDATNVSLIITVGAVNVIGSGTALVNIGITSTAIIPPDSSYSATVTAGTGTIQDWVELR